MATIVGALGVPHTPAFPTTVDRTDESNPTAALFSALAQRLHSVHADVVVMFDSDHLNTFFLDNLPMFAVGVAPDTCGPNDGTPGLAKVELTVAEDLARHIRDVSIDAGFDTALAAEFTVDHSVLVPLHFLMEQWDIPLVPVFTNGLVPPLPSASRCADLGRSVRDAIDGWPEDLRVVMCASGSFSLDVGGPGMAPGKIFGVPDPGWVERVAELLLQADPTALASEVSRDQLLKAGNVGGEVLNWVAVQAAVPWAPAMLELQPEYGHGFAWWQGRE